MQVAETFRAQQALTFSLHSRFSSCTTPYSSEPARTGEVVDMACYLDHGATGEKHAECARECIESGLPVGIKGTDGIGLRVVLL